MKDVPIEGGIILPPVLGGGAIWPAPPTGQAKSPFNR
jgi:hypothetical protein